MLYDSWTARTLHWIAVGAMMTYSSAPAFSACLPSASQASKEELDYFKLNPGQALIRAQRDADKLSQIIARYVGTDITVLGSVKTLAETAPSRYKASVGAGLGLVHQQCAGNNPSWSKRIQVFVDGLQDLDLVSGYRMAVQLGLDTPTPLENSARVTVPPRAAYDLRLIDPFKSIPVPGP